MSINPQINFQNLPECESVASVVRERVSRLEKICPRIIGCRVVVAMPHRHHHKGKLYHVRVDVSLPGTELVVNRNPDQHASHHDVYVAIRDAFDATRRRVQNFLREQRGNVKHHERPFFPNQPPPPEDYWESQYERAS